MTTTRKITAVVNLPLANEGVDKIIFKDGSCINFQMYKFQNQRCTFEYINNEYDYRLEGYIFSFKRSWLKDLVEEEPVAESSVKDLKRKLEEAVSALERIDGHKCQDETTSDTNAMQVIARECLAKIKE